MPLPIATVFADLPDPRADTANKLHKLHFPRDSQCSDDCYSVVT